MLTSAPYSRALSNGLILKSVCSPQDVERLAIFNGHIHGQDVTEMTRSMIAHHPSARPEYWLYIEDETTAQIVSSLALIPWEWRYENVTLKSGEMGIVGTLEAYRNRGLVRELVVRFKELLREGKFDISQIQGVPYFYRQFGYEYAIPLEPGWQIELREIPDMRDERFSFRLATVNDILTLQRLYDESNAVLNISTIRREGVWQFMLEHTAGTFAEGEIWLMLNQENQIIGYWRISNYGFGQGLIVSETSCLSITAAQTLLRWLKATAIDRNKPYIRFNLPTSNDLLHAARGNGAYDSGTYAWQIHVVDAARLLRKMTPILERRIAASSFAGLTEKIVINLYREAFELDFDSGKLQAVNSLGFQDGGEIRIPPMQFTPLILGYRGREELTRMYPDVSIRRSARDLVDVLFPGMGSFLFANY